MKNIRIVLVAWLLLLLLGAPKTYAWSFYTPSEWDISLLTKIETKIKRLHQEKLELLEEKVWKLVVDLVLSPKWQYIIDTVWSMIGQEIERKRLIAVDIVEEEAPLEKKLSEKKTLAITPNHEKMIKSVEWYRRFNKK